MTTSTRSWLASYSGARVTRRKLLAGTAAGIGAAALVACGGGSSGGLKFDDAATARQPGTVWNAANDWKLADETNEAVKGGIYRDSMNSDQSGSYDSLFEGPAAVPFSGHVHEFLMARNRGPGIDPKTPEAEVPVPALAQDFELSSDGLTVTFTLRPNVKFHPTAPVNGRVMDIDDWRTSLERFLSISPQREAMADVLNKAEYPDKTHMVWKLNYPYAPLVNRIWSERFAFQVVPKELNIDPNIAASTSVGTGYKVLDKVQTSVAMEYRKHQDYWGGTPFIDRWSFAVIPEYSNRYAQFVAQNLTSFSPNSRDVLLLAKDAPQAVIVASPIADDSFSRIIFGRFDVDTVPWKDPRVRVAIRKSIDFRSIAEFQSNKQQFEAAGIPVEVVTRTHLMRNPTYWLNPDNGELGNLSSNYLYNVADAKKLLTAAGFNNTIDIPYTYLPSAGAVPEGDGLVIDSLNKSGNFKVEERLSLNATDNRNCRSLRMCLGLVQSAISDDVDYALREYFSKGPRPGGEPSFSDPRLDRIAESYRRELDPEKRIALLKEEQMVAAEFFPTVPYIHQYTTFSFRWPWLHNINYGSGVQGRPVLGGHRQWLDESMPRRNG